MGKHSTEKKTHDDSSELEILTSSDEESSEEDGGSETIDENKPIKQEISMRYSSSFSLDCIISTLSRMGNECNISFSRSGIEIKHNNFDNSVIIIVKVDKSNMAHYIVTNDDVIQFKIDVSLLKGKISKKKSTAISSIINKKQIICAIKDLSTCVSPNCIDQYDKTFIIKPCKVSELIHIETPAFPDEPQVKIETNIFKQIIDEIKPRKPKKVMVVPYLNGVEFFTINKLDEIESKSPYGDSNYHYYQENKKDKKKKRKKKKKNSSYRQIFDKIYCVGTYTYMDYDHFSIISEIIKCNDDCSIINIYFNNDNKKSIKFSSTIKSGGTWEIYISCSEK